MILVVKVIRFANCCIWRKWSVNNIVQKYSAHSVFDKMPHRVFFNFGFFWPFFLIFFVYAHCHRPTASLVPSLPPMYVKVASLLPLSSIGCHLKLPFIIFYINMLTTISFISSLSWLSKFGAIGCHTRCNRHIYFTCFLCFF